MVASGGFLWLGQRPLGRLYLTFGSVGNVKFLKKICSGQGLPSKGIEAREWFPRLSP